MLTWLEQAQILQKSKQAFVIVTLAKVKGHAPRKVGAKMLVTRESSFGSIGGGNLEETTLKRARALLSEKSPEASVFKLILNPQAGTYGIQCCGGEVEIMLEPQMSTRPSIAIFGAGHVGQALCRVLGQLPLDLYLIDSRMTQLSGFSEAPGLFKRHAPIPETQLDELPPDSYLVVLTHDHAEDLAILDKALRHSSFPFIGLIGSDVKWHHFQRELGKQGHSPEALALVTCPLGIPGISAKLPAAIAIATAAQILEHFSKQGVELEP
ncbi:MAG: xanthine dehydrogenase accessory protein XdhC [Trueperaceae bacterium]|nr:xanthine dehydrogenase accessory protein XdhC [Trueperaceae bacterium]